MRALHHHERRQDECRLVQQVRGPLLRANLPPYKERLLRCSPPFVTFTERAWRRNSAKRGPPQVHVGAVVQDDHPAAKANQKIQSFDELLVFIPLVPYPASPQIPRTIQMTNASRLLRNWVGMLV